MQKPLLPLVQTTRIAPSFSQCSPESKQTKENKHPNTSATNTANDSTKKQPSVFTFSDRHQKLSSINDLNLYTFYTQSNTPSHQLTDSLRNRFDLRQEPLIEEY